MSTVALISIKPIYVNQIIAGTKKIELRKSSMGLSRGDIVLIYSSAPEQSLACWFRIKNIETLPVDTMWQQYSSMLGITYLDYKNYFAETNVAVGLHIDEMKPISPIRLHEIEKLVPGFVPPQGIVWLRSKYGKYKELLNRLSVPLPRDAFPQQSFAFETIPSVK